MLTLDGTRAARVGSWQQTVWVVTRPYTIVMRTHLERNLLEDQDVDGKMILERILVKSIHSTNLVQATYESVFVYALSREGVRYY
jgi:hypothetical protein